MRNIIAVIWHAITLLWTSQSWKLLPAFIKFCGHPWSMMLKTLAQVCLLLICCFEITEPLYHKNLLVLGNIINFWWFILFVYILLSSNVLIKSRYWNRPLGNLLGIYFFPDADSVLVLHFGIYITSVTLKNVNY